MADRWIFPHCEHAAFITAEQNKRYGFVRCDIPNAEGHLVTQTWFTVCPNPACKRTTATVGLSRSKKGDYAYANAYGEPLVSVRLLPPSYARPIPDYVPGPIRQDYTEACAIVDLSPKASATLARRALQGIIREFHGIVRATLHQEILALKGVVDPITWSDIDAVRGVGNIGAHMEKDINVIVDVEPDEAVRLIRLIEMLIRDWYVARFNREQELAAIIALGQEKQEQRRTPPTAPPASQEVGEQDGEPNLMS